MTPALAARQRGVPKGWRPAREVRAVSTAKISEGSNDSIAVRLQEEHVRLPHVQARGAAHATPMNRLARLGPGLGK